MTKCSINNNRGCHGCLGLPINIEANNLPLETLKGVNGLSQHMDQMFRELWSQFWVDVRRGEYADQVI